MILNLHGLNGRWDNTNYGQLRLMFPDEEIHSQQIDYLGESPEDLLDDLVVAGPYSLVVGQSLGGFFAYVLGAVEGWPTVLTNPCIPPHEYLPGLVDDFRYLEEVEAIWNGTYPRAFDCTAIVGRCDEVVDHRRTIGLLKPYYRVLAVDSGHSLSGAEYVDAFRGACIAMRSLSARTSAFHSG